MPVTEPPKSVLNFTPTSTGLRSPASTVVGAAKSRIVSCGVTAFEAVDAGPVPTPLVAVTLNVYAVPVVSPVIVLLVVDAPTWTAVWAAEPMYGVTV